MKYSFKGTYQIKATDDFGQELDASDICLDPEIKNDFEADWRENMAKYLLRDYINHSDNWGLIPKEKNPIKATEMLIDRESDSVLITVEADRRLNVSELVSIAKEISAQMSDGFGEDTSNETWIAGHTEAFNPSYSGEECDDEEYVHSEINCRVEFGLDWKLI